MRNLGQDSLNEQQENDGVDHQRSNGQQNFSYNIQIQVNQDRFGGTTDYVQSGKQPRNDNIEQMNNGQILVKKIRRGFAGETKNHYKNKARAFQEFIRNTLDSIYYNDTIKKFLKERNIGKQKFEKYLKDEQLKKLELEFSDQLAWVRSFLQSNRSEIQQYFRTLQQFEL